MSETGARRRPRWSAALHDARLAQGWSLAELAQRAKLSLAVVQQGEAGKDLSHDTLQSLMDALPDLDPSALFPEGRGRMPWPTEAAWRSHRELLGYSVRRFVRELDLEAALLRSDWRGVRCHAEDLRDADVRTALMRTVCDAGGGVLARLAARDSDLEGREQRFEADDSRFAFHFPRALTRHGFSLSREAPASSEPNGDCDTAEACIRTGTAVVIRHPIERLELRLRRPDASEPWEPVAACWPDGLVPTGELSADERAGSGLVGRIGVRRRGREVVLTVERPLIGTCHALGWRRAEARPTRRAAPAGARSRGAPPADGVLGERLRLARERAGLTKRALARKAGGSPMTLTGTETGRVPRRSTLARYLRALPELSPWSLFDLDDDAALAPHGRLWFHARDLYGCESLEETKIVRIEPDGRGRIEIRTRGLRALRRLDGPLRLRLGLGRPVLQATHAQLRGVDAEGEELRIARVAGAEGLDLHELVIPAPLARRGVSFTRELDHPGVYALTAERARERTGQDGPYNEGATFGALVPTRLLRLVVRFPPEAWPPSEEKPCAWSLAQVPHPETPGFFSTQPPPGLRLERDPRHRQLRLEVERPVMGVKYAIAWYLR